jgi:hypothetical protein
MHLNSRRSLLTFALAALLVLGACGGSDKKTAATSSSSKSSSSSSSSKSSSSSSSSKPASSDSATEEETDVPTVGPIVALSVDGLTFVSDPATRNLTFGTDEPTVTSALKAALGEPSTTDIGRPCDDGSSRAFDSVRYDGLVVFFFEAQLSGWSAENKEFTTIDGIGPGSTLSDLKAAFPDVTVNPDSSLGVEFSSSTVGGVLDGTSDGSKVTTIFNGDLCILR